MAGLGRRVSTRSARVAYRDAASLAAGAATATWWTTGLTATYRGEDHAVGPFRVPLALEYVVAAVVIAMTCAAVSRIASRRHRDCGLLPASCLFLMLSGALVAWLWRVITAGGDGANIGAGLAIVFGPFFVGIVISAVVVRESSQGAISTVRFGVLFAGVWVGALLTAVVGWFALG